MNILFVAAHYYPYIGGVEYVVKSLAERLAKLGHEITVLAGEPNSRQVKEEIINEVKVIRWPTWTWKDAYHIPKKRSKLLFTLKELLKDNVDVIHVHSAHAVLPVYVGIKVKELYPSIKLVFSPHYHAHGHTLVRELAWQILWRKYVRKLVKYADKIHAVSILEAKRIINHYPEAWNKLIIIPNGVEEDAFQYKWKGQNSNYVVYAGRIEKYKRLELAMDVAKKLGLRLLIVGQGPHRTKLEKYAGEKYRGVVEFLEPQPRDKYLELLSKARYAINPSKHEAYSIFTAEALAIGVPAIISKEIAENLKAESKPLNKQLVLAEKAPIKTWNEIVQIYLSKLYRT